MPERGHHSDPNGSEGRSREVKKQNSRVMKIALGTLLTATGGGIVAEYVAPYIATEYRKSQNANPEKAKDFAQQALEASDEGDSKEKFEASLNFYVQALINAGESDERVEQTREFFTKLVDKFEIIAKTEKDKKKVLFALFQELGRYEPEKARISDIAFDHVGNCEARAASLLLTIPAIYPDQEVQAQFFGSSSKKQAEPHIRVLTKFDGDGDGTEEWFAIEGDPTQVTEEQMKGTVLASDTVFQASVVFGDDPQELSNKSEAYLVPQDEDTEKNDGDFGISTNSLFNLSVFTGSATETYGEGGGPSQPESEEAYKERMKETPRFREDNILPIQLDILPEQGEEYVDHSFHEKKYELVPLPEEIKQKAIKEGKLILDAFDYEKQKYIELPLYDLRQFSEDMIETGEVRKISIRSSDRRLIEQYFKMGSSFNFDVMFSIENIYYFTAKQDTHKVLFNDPDIKILKMSVATSKLEGKDFFQKTFHDLESFQLSYPGKVSLPNFGDKLESGDIIQDISQSEDIVSLQDLRPLFGKKLKKFNLWVRATRLDVSIPFDRNDLIEKGIVSADGQVEIDFRN